MCAVGSNSVIMPKTPYRTAPYRGIEFCAVEFKFKPWSVYAGIPIRFIRKEIKQCAETA